MIALPQTVGSTTCAALGPWWPRWPAPLACTGTVSWTRATGHTTWTAGRTGYSVQRDGWPGAAAATSCPGTGSAVNLLNLLLAVCSFHSNPCSLLCILTPSHIDKPVYRIFLVVIFNVFGSKIA